MSMRTIVADLEEPRADETRPASATPDRGKGAPDALKAAIAQQIRAARRATRRTRFAAEDLRDAVRLRTRHRPLQTITFAFGVGAITGFLALLAARNRHER